MGKNNKTSEQKQYEKLEQQYETKRPVLKNCIKAFFVGGTICAIGQAVSYFYIYFLILQNRQQVIQQLQQ